MIILKFKLAGGITFLVGMGWFLYSAGFPGIVNPVGWVGWMNLVMNAFLGASVTILGMFLWWMEPKHTYYS